MPYTIAVLSQKGGTGKTTAVRTLADAFRRSEMRTLAVDLDPQGNLSDYFDLDPGVEIEVVGEIALRIEVDRERAHLATAKCVGKRAHGSRLAGAPLLREHGDRVGHRRAILRDRKSVV